MEFHEHGQNGVSNGENFFFFDTYQNVILRLDCDTGSSALCCQWTKLQQKFQWPRTNAVAFLVPDHLTNCNVAKKPGTCCNEGSNDLILYGKTLIYRCCAAQGTHSFCLLLKDWCDLVHLG